MMRTVRSGQHRAIAAALIVPLAALGCTQSESTEVGTEITASVTPDEFQAVVDQVAFDPAYVALQQKAISLSATIFPRAAVLTPQQQALLKSEHVTKAQVLGLTGVTEADLTKLAQLGATVRARFPWITTHGVNLHRVATVTNPALYAAYENALATVPVLDVRARNPATQGERMAAARAAMLARVAADTGGNDDDTPADPGPSGYCCWAQDISIIIGALAPMAIIIVAMAINPAVGAVVALAVFAIYAAFLITVWVISVLDDIVDWFEDTADWLDDSFGHDDDTCTDESDCPSNMYCDNGDFLAGMFGTNECKADKSEGSGCWKDAECQTGCCKFNWGRMQCRPSDKCD